MVLMDAGLSGLTDTEYFWEPVSGGWSVRRVDDAVAPLDDVWGDDQWGLEIEYPEPQPSPFTTIAWRMAHMTQSALVAAAAIRGRRAPSGFVDNAWPEFRSLPTTADAAVARWHAAIGMVVEMLASASHQDLERAEHQQWEPTPQPVWRHVEYFAYFEPASHGAEVRLLRDLFRHTSTASFAPPAKPARP